MVPAVTAIVAAQFRILRNHLPKAGVASFLGHLVSLLWYGLAAAVGFGLAVLLPSISLPGLMRELPAGLLGVFAFWQIMPLFTLSTGWSLQLNKLQIYPISDAQLFLIEVILRVTGSPEMILVLMGATVGLLRHPGVPVIAALALLLFIPFNLFVSLGLRELMLHSFKRNRFREIFAILMISLSILPQIVLRSSVAKRLLPYFEGGAQGRLTPWHAVAMLSLGRGNAVDVLTLAVWTLLSFAAARWLFMRSLSFEEATEPILLTSRETPARAGLRAIGWSTLLHQLLGDPLSSLVEKELRSLVRMPRFRIRFGMACIFSVLIFVPLAHNTVQAGSNFLQQNFLPVTTLYGLLLLSDAVIWNVFGPDRGAAALYFAAPIPFALVLRAKNIVAGLCVAAESIIVLTLTALLRQHIDLSQVGTSLGSAAVVGLFFVAIGNYTSVTIARPADSKQMLRRTGGGKMQLLMLGCSLGMAVLVGAALLARWAFDSPWAFPGVLAIEMIVAFIVYKVVTHSALEHSSTDRERMIDELSKKAAVIGSEE